METSYRFQAFQWLQIVLDIQLLLDPARNPEDAHLWITGIRTSLQF